MFTQNKNKILVIILVFLLFIGGGFVIWQSGIVNKIYNNIKLGQETKIFGKARNYVLNSTEPTSISQAIPDLEKLIDSSLPKEREAQAKTLLALAYYYGAEPDAPKAISLLKETATNENYPKLERAIAVQYIAEIADDYGELFAQQHIFIGQPFENFYKDKNLSLAIRKLNEWADSLWPIPIPNYRIADWYAERLVRDKFSPYLTEKKREEYQSILNQRLTKANTIFANVPMESWNQDRLMLSYLLRAKILGKLYVVQKDQTVKAEADKYFLLALEVYKKYFLPKGTGYAVPFHYAAFLTETNLEPNPEKINSLLTPIYEQPRGSNFSFSFFNFLEREKNSTHDKHYHKREILLLAKSNSRFGDLLKNLGWTEAQLNIKITPVAYEK